MLYPNTFHRANLPSWMLLEDWADELASSTFRKVGLATKMTNENGTTEVYYYRGVEFDQDMSVPNGYYGRWKTRKFATDSLKHTEGTMANYQIMEMFNERVRRIANLRAYGMTSKDIIKQVDATEAELYLLVAAADLFLVYAPFDLLEHTERTEPVLLVSGEIDVK